MRNYKTCKSNDISAQPLKDSNHEDFYLKSEKNRNLFLKFSENARKKIENISFNFNDEEKKKEFVKETEKQNFHKSKLFDEISSVIPENFKENNPNLHDFFENENIKKSNNSYFVFDYNT